MKEGILRKIYEQDPQEKGETEVTQEGKLEVNRKEEGENEKIVNDEIAQDIIPKVIETLDNELNIVLPYQIENPEKFKASFEEELNERSIDKNLDVIDKYIEAFSVAYDKLDEFYKGVLEQRMDYKDIPDAGVNKEMKSRLDDRIHKAQERKKNTHDLIEYLDSKRIEYILRGVQEGNIESHEENEIGDENN